ncbi:MAG: cytochrome c-type biogenesis protein CcmH [Burkholderiales bacterium]|nr:MAG: cytochrome c-type biogenesis protein CcmH [Burkholderiales bacterium]
MIAALLACAALAWSAGIAVAQGQAQPAGAGPAGSASGAVRSADATALHSERFNRLAEELRCLVCQNQTLADSNAGLAGDLRKEVEAQIAQGKSDDQIKAYLVERYGDFVLYRPPVQGNTVLLWLGPFALLAVGAAAWLVVQRRGRERRAELVPTGDDDRERARRMLD